MTIELLDYRGTPVEHDVGNIEDIAGMFITVLSGDETLRVIYKDYSEKHFDSSDCRSMSFLDYSYELYDYLKPDESILNKEEFKNRESSYWGLVRNIFGV